MSAANRWLLPEGVEELLPPEGWQLEALRRRLLDLYRRWGYELILPPLIEYLDALLTGAGSDLDLATFKLTDQLSGRLMGLRADVTPQAARIDANRLDHSAPSRLCYIDSVLRTRPATGGGPRTLRQVGCELFGHDGIESDLEVLELMLATLSAAGVAKPHLDLGHVGVFRALAAACELSAADEALVFDLLQRKSVPDLQATGLPDRVRAVFADLMRRNGSVAVIAEARDALGVDFPSVVPALDELQGVADALAERYADLPVHVDLAELRGYSYHTGLVFGAFVADHGRELARGGRYNDVGRAFGGGRPATGFSANLHDLLRFGAAPEAHPAPLLADAACTATMIAEARAAGYAVVSQWPGGTTPEHSGRLVPDGAAWRIDMTTNGQSES